MEGDAVLDAVDDAEGTPGEVEPENKPVGDTGRESVN